MRRAALLGILILAFGALLVITPWLLAPRQGHLTLLTVVATDEGRQGGTADVYLELRPGNGDVYIATFPFTRLDTQISTRFAKEVACAHVQAPCDSYDFFYTIRADSTIVGGPSAGAALAALTIALLEGKPIDQGVAITGTINSGGIVGPVGGTDEKARAAAVEGLHTVVVPRWREPLPENMTNASVALNDSFPGVVIIEVATIDEVLAALTGEIYTPQGGDLVVPEAYDRLMQAIASRLCNHTEQLRSQLPLEGLENDALYNESEGFILDSLKAEELGKDYSRASYCFSANLRLRELQLRNLSDEQLSSLAVDFNRTIDERLLSLHEQSLVTFADLQTKAIVDERLREAASYLEREVTPNSVAYAIERYRSAVIWSNFFQLPGDEVSLDDAHLRAACEAKLAEVEERKSYLSVLFGQPLFVDEGVLRDAYALYRDGDYSLCLSKASMAKAQIDVVISGVAVSEDDFDDLLGEKLLAARRVIARELDQGRFPVMGYSYYEYAVSLREDDPYTAALFASYALELADLSMYFPYHEGLRGPLRAIARDPFVLGFLAGLLGAAIVVVARFPSQKKRAARRP